MFKFVINDDLTPHLKTIESRVRNERKMLLKLISEDFKAQALEYIPVDKAEGVHERGFLRDSGFLTIKSTSEFAEASIEYTGKKNPKQNRKSRLNVNPHFYADIYDKDMKGVTKSNIYTWDYALFQEMKGGFLSEAIGDYEMFNEIDQVIGAEYLKLLRK